MVRFLMKQTLITYLLQCSLSNESQSLEEVNCNCEILQIYNSDNPSSYHNFTKHAGEINGKPFFFSIKSRMIQWSNLTTIGGP